MSIAGYPSANSLLASSSQSDAIRPLGASRLSRGGGQSALDALRAANAAAKRPRGGAVIADWSAGPLTTTGSTGTGFDFALDSTVIGPSGKPAVKCTFASDATSQTFIGILTPTNPIRIRDVTGVQIPILFTSASTADNVGNVGNPIQVWLQTSNAKSIRFQISLSDYQAGVWQTFSFARGSLSITTNQLSELDAAGVTITSIRIVQSTNAAAANSNPVWFDQIRCEAGQFPGRVIITMDGAYATQFAFARSILRDYDLRATLYLVNSGIGGSVGGVSCMTLDQLGLMHDEGHEFGHHTYDGTKTGGYGNSGQWTAAADIAEDILSQWEFLRDNGWPEAIGHACWGFTYGFTETLSQARQNLVRDGLRMAGVTTMRKSASYNGEVGTMLVPMNRNKLPIDPYVLPGALQVSNTHTAAQIISCLDAAENRGEAAILTFHHFVKAGATAGSLGTTETILRTVAEEIRTRADAGRLITQPMSEFASDVLAL